MVYLVLWYREDLGKPIYSFDARDYGFDRAQHWSEQDVLGNRAYFKTYKNLAIPAKLSIENLMPQDQGVYRCRVDFKVSQTRNSRVNLTVIIPPSSPDIMDSNGHIIQSLVGPYQEGNTLHLTCISRDGRPKPRVTWFRDGIFLDTPSYTTKDGDVRSDLQVHNLIRSDLRSNFTCRASNNNISRPSEATVTLDMNLKPLTVLIQHKNQPLSAGTKNAVVCISTGSRPLARITWTLDGRRLTSAKEEALNNGNTTRSTLTLIPGIEDSNKYLKCTARNPVLNTGTLDDTWKLLIHYVPQVSIHIGSSLRLNQIKEGDDVYFECQIRANPAVRKVEWKHNDRLIQHNINAGVIITNQSLVLQKINRTDAGNYSCLAYNQEGMSQSTPLYLNVKYSPTCSPGQVKVHGVARHEDAQIPCRVEANPSNVTFVWKFNNTAETIDVPNSRFVTNGTWSVVSYKPNTELDYGTLLCTARNDVGEQQVPCVFHIIAAGRPDPVFNCTVFNRSVDSFHLQCMEGFNGGLPQTFILEVFHSQLRTLKANVTNTDPRFTVNSLESGTGYVAHVYAVNAKGKSDVMSMQVFTMSLPEKHLTTETVRTPPRFEVTPLMGILIGVVAALVMVALIVVIVLRLQCTAEERRKKEEDKSNSSPLKRPVYN